MKITALIEKAVGNINAITTVGKASIEKGIARLTTSVQKAKLKATADKPTIKI